MLAGARPPFIVYRQYCSSQDCRKLIQGRGGAQFLHAGTNSAQSPGDEYRITNILPEMVEDATHLWDINKFVATSVREIMVLGTASVLICCRNFWFLSGSLSPKDKRARPT